MKMIHFSPLSRTLGIVWCALWLSACVHVAESPNVDPIEPQVAQADPFETEDPLPSLAEPSPPEPSSPEPPPRQDTFVLNDDSDLIGRLYVITTRREHTLVEIARQYGLGYEEIKLANPDVNPWFPGRGTQIVLPTRHVLPDAPRKGIVLNLAAMRLFYFPKPKAGEPAVVVTHPIGIGRDGWLTPKGFTKIIQKVAGPTWRVPASIRREHALRGDPLPAVVWPGPDNPLGQYAMRLSMPSYLIHGTNKPGGVGMRVSHGCVRLFPEDIETLFQQVPLGTRVNIVEQPYLAGWDSGRLYLEIHKPPADSDRVAANRFASVSRTLGKTVRNRSVDPESAIDWQRTADLVGSTRGFPVEVSAESPGIEQVLADMDVFDISKNPQVEAALMDEVPTDEVPTDEMPTSEMPTDEVSTSEMPTSEVPTDEMPTSELIAEDGPWYVQVGSFKLENNADKLIAILSEIDPPIAASSSSTDEHFRVLAGPYRTRDEAEVTAERIGSVLGTNTLVISASSPP